MGWDVEKPVWWRAFRSILEQQPQECGLLMTEAPFNLPSIQASTMQVTQPLPDALVSTYLVESSQNLPGSALYPALPVKRKLCMSVDEEKIIPAARLVPTCQPAVLLWHQMLQRAASRSSKGPSWSQRTLPWLICHADGV